MNIGWGDVAKLITVLSGASVIITSVGAFLVWIFKKWILNLFKKDFAQYEKRINKELKENELNRIQENKNIELRLGEEIRKSELQLSKQIGFEQNHNQILIDTFNGVWVDLLILYEFMAHDYFKKINSLNSNNPDDYLNPVREKVFNVKRRTLFLPDTINAEVTELLDKKLLKGMDALFKVFDEITKARMSQNNKTLQPGGELDVRLQKLTNSLINLLVLVKT